MSVLFFFSMGGTPARASTSFSGSISQDTTWTAANSPYILTGNVTVNAGYTLTIEPGVVVKPKYSSYGLTVYGTLNASNDVFTSYKDDFHGGDTNLDGLLSLPAPGDWFRINFSNGSGTLTDCTIAYGDSSAGQLMISGAAANVSVIRTYVLNSASSGIYLSTTSPNVSISDSHVDGNATYGLYSTYAISNVWGNSFDQNHGAAMYVPAVIGSGVHDNSYSGNGINAMELTGDVTATTTWAASNSPYVLEGIQQGTSQSRWTRISNSSTLTVEPNTVVKFKAGANHTDNYHSLVVSAGTLNASGAAFTSFFDDSLGGDTNGDGSNSSPQAGDWSQVYFMGGGGSLATCSLAYGGSSTYGGSPMLSIGLATVSLTDSAIHDSMDGGVSVGTTPVTITGNIISDNKGNGVAATGSLTDLADNRFIDNKGIAVSMPGIGGSNVHDNSYEGNGTNGMFLSADIGQNTTWPASNSPYVIQGGHGGMIGNKWMQVNSGATLTIEPGAVVKFNIRLPRDFSHNTDNTLTVGGGLIADGVIFTSFFDDSVGGDTNGDGDATVPQPGDWNQIQLQSSQTLSFAGTTIRYGGSFGTEVSNSASAPVFSNATISDSASGGLAGGGNPSITGTIFANNNGDALNISTSLSNLAFNQFINNNGTAVVMPGIGGPNVRNNTYSGNKLNAMFLSADIAQDTTWPASNSPYVIQGGNGGLIGNKFLVVNTGSTLTIESGAVVKFNIRLPRDTGHNTDNSLDVFGGLVADGVVFTSLFDDSAGGDTNADGNATLPQAGDWNVIQLGASQAASLAGTTVRFGGSFTTCELLIGTNSAPVISGTTISDSASGGIDGSGHPSITGSTFSNNNGDALKIGSMSDLANNRFVNNNGAAIIMPAIIGNNVKDNTYEGNRLNAMFLSADIEQDTTWAASNSPYVIVGGHLGPIGNMWMDIDAGTTLTIEPGTVVKFNIRPDNVSHNRDLTLWAFGGLIADGVTFTSYYDDSVGGDTNGDGGANSPQPGDWADLEFSTNLPSSLCNATVRYGGFEYQELFVANPAQLNITGSTIEQSASGGISIGGSGGNTVVNSSTIQDNATYGLYSVTPIISLTNNSFSSNGDFAVKIPATLGTSVSENRYFGNKKDAMFLTGNVTAPSVWPQSNSPYVLDTNIQAYAALSIDPDTIVKISSGLNVVDFSATNVLFTSVNDDANGGDTNGDGGATTPAPGDWDNITTAGLNGSISHCTLIYGGRETAALYMAGNTGLNDSVITQSIGGGAYVATGNPAISNNVFSQNDYGLKSQVALRSMANNQFLNNANVAVRMPASIREGVNNNVYSGNGHDAMYLFGNVTSRADWDTTNSPFVLENSIQVTAPLDVQPGAVVKLGLNGNTLQYIQVSSVLKATGAIFTSYYDDNYDGDTNKDGQQTSPHPGDWKSIYFASGSNGLLDGVTIRFGGASAYGEITSSATGLIDQIHLASCTYISDPTENAYCTAHSMENKPVIRNSSISYSQSSGIAVLAGSPYLNDNDIYANESGYGVETFNNNVAIDAERNWWGGAGGPSPFGTGNGFVGRIDVRNWYDSPLENAGKAAAAVGGDISGSGQGYQPSVLDDKTLAEMYAPELHFKHDINDPDRTDYEPRPIELMLNVPGSKFVSAQDKDDPNQPSVEMLQANPQAGGRIDIPGSPFNPLDDYTAAYRSMVDSQPDQYPITAYTRVIHNAQGSDKTIIQYWMLYYFNNYVNNHEGDWEMVEVILDRNQNPLAAAYSQHGQSQTKFWTEQGLEKNDTHPKVWVGEGSHANIFSGGILGQHLLGSGFGSVASRTENTGDASQAIPDVNLDWQDKGWLDYEGLWGQKSEDWWPPYAQSGPPGPQFQPPSDYGKSPWNQPYTWAFPDASCSANQEEVNGISIVACSPVEINLIDSNGNHVGVGESGIPETQIANAEYYERSISHSKNIIVHGADKSSDYRLEVSGNGTGTMDLKIQVPDPSNNTVDKYEYLNVPVNEAMKAQLEIGSSADGILRVDDNDDGTIDEEITPESQPVMVDFTPPAAITDLQLVNISSDSAALAWTAPGDDGNLGTAARYELRYSASPITEANWNDASLGPAISDPKAAGDLESAIVTQLSPGTTYYFAIKSRDDAWQESPLSNVVSATYSGPPPDTTPPVTTDDAVTTWSSTDGTITLSCTDEGSGCATTTYTVDGGETQTGTTIYITSEGTHTIIYRSIDAAGNIENDRTVTVMIDKTAPVLSNVGPAGIINAAAATLSAGVQDGLSGIDTASLSAEVDGNPVACQIMNSQISCPLSGLPEGNHAFGISVADVAGNPSSVTGSFLVDTIDPAITGVSPDGWQQSTDVTLAASITDDGSGIDPATIDVKLDGADVSCSLADPALSCPVTGLGEGIHYYRVSASDNAGNPASADGSFSIDSIAPVISGLQPAGVINMTSPSIGFGYADGGSGIDPGTMQVLLDGNPLQCTSDGARAACPAGSLDYGNHVISGELKDIAGNIAPITGSFYINAPPDVTIGGNVNVDEGQPAFNSGTAGDSDGDTLTLTASAGAVTLDGSGTWQWSYPAVDGPDNSQTVTITASDGRGGVTSASFDLAVNNVSPVITDVSAPIEPTLLGSAINLAASFTDAGIADTHTATIDWGDSQTGPATVTENVGAGTLGSTHIYAGAGVYTIRVTISDDDGGTAESYFRYAVIYDPAGGFVTGGGWIDSPAGALVSDPGLTGRANFGFVSRYQNGASVPSGNTEFQFKAGSLNFSSTLYDWLVIGGAKAQYKGAGTVNGQGSYAFLLSAIDGDVSGGGGQDKFRIKIWDQLSGLVIYDNMLGADETADPATVLGGGSVVIHRN